MDEESSSDATGEPNGAGGDASQLLHRGETDNAINISSKLDKEEQNDVDVPPAAASAVSNGNHGNQSGLSVQDVKVASTGKASTSTSTMEQEMEAANPSVTLSPTVDRHGEGDGSTPEKMCVDPEDTAESGASPGTVSSEDSEKSSPTGSKSRGAAGESESLSTSNVGESLSTSNAVDGGASAPDSPTRTVSDNPSDSDDADDGDGAGVVNWELLTAGQRNILQRRRVTSRRSRRQHQLSSSSESLVDLLDDLAEDRDEDDDDEDNAAAQAEDDSDEDGEEIRRLIDRVVDKPKPKPNWFAMRELRQREYGSASRRASSWFRDGVQSSLHMAMRMVTVERMKAHAGCVNALSFNRIGTLLASGSDDLEIILWNWQKSRPAVVYSSGHRTNVFQAKFMPLSGDTRVVSCARDGQVRLAELSNAGVCQGTRKLGQHRSSAHKLAPELESPHLFMSCGEDALVLLFDLRQKKPHKLVTAKENVRKVPLYSIHCNPRDSNQFCVGGRDPYIRVYDRRKISERADGGLLKSLCPDHLEVSDFQTNVTCACYNYNGAEILGTYNDEAIYLFDNTMSDGANYIHKYEGHRNSSTVKGVNFYGPKSEFIVSGSDCGNVYFWDKETEAVINFKPGDHTGVINVLEPHPTLPVLATSGLDHDIKLWMPMLSKPRINWNTFKRVLKKNHMERQLDRSTSEPEIGGQMLWFIMNQFRNTARRRMREEGQELSSSDDFEDDSDSNDSETNPMQCAQS